MPLPTNPQKGLTAAIVAVSGLAFLALLAATIIIVVVQRDRTAATVTNTAALRWAEVGAEAAARVETRDMTDAEIASAMRPEIEFALRGANRTTFRLIAPSGVVLDASEQSDIGKSLDPLLFTRLAGAGSLVGSDDVITAQRLDRGISEAIVPVTVDGIPAAYLALTADRREQVQSLDDFTGNTLIAVSVILVVVGVTVVLVLYKHLSHRERAQGELHKIARDLDLAEQVAHVGHWSTDYREGKTAWSPEMFRIFGVDPGTFIPSNETVLPMIVTDDRPRIEKNIAEMRAGADSVEYEMRIRRPSGEIRILNQNVVPQRNKDGSVAIAFGVAHDITDLRKTTEALAEREKMLDRAIEAAGAATWEWNLDASGRVSRHFAQMLGYEAETFVPRFDLSGKLIHPEDIDRVKAALKATVENNAPYNIDYRMRHVRGHYIWINSRGQLQYDAFGKPYRLSGTMTDITAQREAEEKLKSNQEILQLALDAANAGFFSREEGERTIFWSPRMKEMLGYGNDFTPDMAFFGTLIHPDHRAAFVKRLSEAVAAREPFSDVIRVKHAAGHYLWLKVRGMTQFDAQGVPVRHVGFILDVTAEKTTAEEVAATKELLERAIEGSNAAIWEWDPKTDTFALSGRIGDIIGAVPKGSKLTSAELSDITHPDDLPSVRAAITEALKSGKQYDIEHRLRHADGHYVWVQSRGRAVSDAAGQVLRMTGSVIDVTERRNAQDDLRANRETLELAIAASNAGFFTREFDP
ncbi:MAG: PAS domain-containing protein, partial [Rhodobacteraceae bacterium]|nr:PAS domain-containing protein [Paracoccaceae bacterium]